ncbi:MAG: MATE family efflux transporter [Clostridia bacterium]|nr:MATE family efflux transporter [Clostridia bacterium]
MQLLTKGLSLNRDDMKRILVIMLPAMVELLMSQLFTMVDTIMLGHSNASTVAIAAVGLTNTPFNLFNGMMNALNVGTTAAVAWAIGANDRDSARAIARTAMTMNLIVGAVVTCILYIGAPMIITFMKAEADAYQYAVDYLRVIALGMTPLMLTYGITGALRGVGKTKLPMLYNLFANLLNVFGNYILIYGKLGFPALGVTGAAISTTLSRVIAFLLASGVLFFGRHPIRLTMRGDYRLHRQWLGRITRVGSTAAAEQLIMQIGFMMFALTVSGLGTKIFAAHQIALNVNGLTWMPAQAFGVAATAIVGQCLGAGDKLKARDFVRVIHRMSMGVAVLIGVLFLLFSQYIAALYTTEVETARLAAVALKWIAVGLPGICTQIPVAAALRGAGDTRFPLIASATGIWVFRVLVAPLFVYNFGWGLSGAWVSIALDQTTRAAVVYGRFLTGKWMEKKV